QIAVKNEGKVNLTGISVSDPMITLTGPAGDLTDPGVLDPGETWIYKGDYTVTQSDIATNGGGTGLLTNTATVRCNELLDKSSTLELPIVNPVQTDTNNGDNTSANVRPVASFSTSVTSGYVPLTVQFTDTSTGTPTSWSWDFGDEVASAEQNPVHMYNTQGTYTAKLTVNNANGSASTTATINVLQKTSSSGGGSSHSSGGSIGSANVVGSSSTDSTGTTNVTKPKNNISNIEPRTKSVNVEPTSVQTATSISAKQSKKTPSFEIISGITALLAVYLYRRK
ncbi:PKD domain-containing protein, partial [Methanosarcina sp. Z-7115]